MTETCGQLQKTLSESYSHDTSSLKTCPVSLGYPIAILENGIWKTPQLTIFGISEPYSQTWPKSGLMQDGQCWELTMSVPPIAESACGLWRTPSATEADHGGPNARDSKGGITHLSAQVMWPTPHGFSKDGKSNGPSGNELGFAVNRALWPSPADRDYRSESCGNDFAMTRNSESRGKPLSWAVTWPTPQASEARQGLQIRREGKKGTQESLSTVVKTYPTPSTEDYKIDGPKVLSRIFTPEMKTSDQRLRNFVVAGEEQTQRAGRLNPDWVEWLMGWPVGWTSLEPLTELNWLDWSVDPADSGEIPRVTTGVKDRVNRLKAIGNGQVPMCMATAWNLLGGTIVRQEAKEG